MVFTTRANVFIVLALILAVLASLVGGGVITSSDLQWQWLLSGAFASYLLALLV